MDASQFDDLTKALATGTSRRRVLTGLLGGAGAGALSLLGLRSAGASHGRPAGATCLGNEHCASDLCDPQTRRCVCPGGTTACGGQCVSTTCPTGQTLSNSSCQCVCTERSAAVRDRGGGDLLFDLPNLQRRHVQRRGRLRRVHDVRGRDRWRLLQRVLLPVLVRLPQQLQRHLLLCRPLLRGRLMHHGRPLRCRRRNLPGLRRGGRRRVHADRVRRQLGVCPAGSQCIANAVCAELCTAT